MGKRGIIVIISALFLCLLVPAISYGLNTIEKLNMTLPKNVYVDDIDLGEKPLTEAINILKNRDEQILNRRLYIYSKEGMQSHGFTLKDLGYKSNVEEIVKEISDILNNDLSIIEKYKEFKNLEKEGVSFEVGYTIDKENFMEALEVFDDEVLNKPVNAESIFADGVIRIVGGEHGFNFDKDKLYDSLVKDDDKLETTQIPLELKVVEPEVTVADIEEKMGIKEKVASFTTFFEPGDEGRTTNILLSAKAIDGVIIPPDGTFSFNRIVGERTKERGYKDATVYISGRVAKGIGGGICQVSTTLYNALLFHDLEIIERSNHSLTVPYVPLARDAAISWGYKDLKFRNNSDHHIRIDAKVKEDKVMVDLYSSKSNKTVELESITLSKVDAPIQYIEDKTLPEGTTEILEAGHTGYRAKLIKRVYENGKLIENKVVSTDRYLTSPKIIKINPLSSQ